MTNQRKLAAMALLRVERDGAYSNLVLNELIKNSDLDKQASAFVSALFYGVLERKITLDYLITKLSSKSVKKISPLTLQVLRSALYQILYMESVPHSAAVNEAVNIIKRSKESFASGFVNAVLRAALRKIPSLPEEDDADSLSVRYSCGKSLISKLLSDYGPENTKRILSNVLLESTVFIRVNTLKTTVKELANLLAVDGVTCEETEIPDSLAIKGAGSIERNRYYKQGYFHVQDLSSQLCSQSLEACAGNTVLDICAAPGGKTFTICEMMGDSGKIIACDLHSHRVELIEKGAKRLCLKSVETRVLDATKQQNDLISGFDRVLCDAPCSGSGIISRKPDIKYKDFDNNAELHSIQFAILENAFSYLKVGGKLVYSTCSILKSENEDIVSRLVSCEESAHVVSTKTLLPGIDDTDGFFICVIEKRG